MPHPDPIEARLRSSRPQLQQLGCLEASISPSTLRNPIHPLFHQSRWMRGHGQKTLSFYPRMAAPLRLASLWLTEDHMLHWWAHLHHGTPTPIPYSHILRRSTSHFLAPSSNSFTSTGRSRVRNTLQILPSSIIFHFQPLPEPYTNTNTATVDAFDAETGRLSWLPRRAYSSLFHPQDYPPSTDPDPVEISLSDDFQTHYHTGYHTKSTSQNLRVDFNFAVTLVHEIAHAYSILVHGRRQQVPEPLWSKYDVQDAELGFSWERECLGRVCLFWESDVQEAGVLVSVKTFRFLGGEGGEEGERRRCERELERFYSVKIGSMDGGLEIRAVHGGAGAAWREICKGGNHLRRTEGSAREKGKWWVCVVDAVPTEWVAKWFSEEVWEKRRQFWGKVREEVQGQRKLVRGGMTLGKTWSLVLVVTPEEVGKMWVCSLWGKGNGKVREVDRSFGPGEWERGWMPWRAKEW